MTKPASTKQQAPSRNPASCLLPPTHYSRGFALLVAIIFMSVMLAFGLALASFAYKQSVLATSAVQSQYAFYAADAGLECALYADQGENQNLFAYPTEEPPPTSVPKINCDGIEASYHPEAPGGIATPPNGTQWVIAERLSLDSGLRCADVTIYKLNGSQAGQYNYIFSQGYDVSCDTVRDASLGLTVARFVARGISVRY